MLFFREGWKLKNPEQSEKLRFALEWCIFKGVTYACVRGKLYDSTMSCLFFQEKGWYRVDITSLTENPVGDFLFCYTAVKYYGCDKYVNNQKGLK